MSSYKELNVWKEAMELSVKVYGVTNGFPAQEKFGLVDQLRRCSVSIPSNIAEGNGRSSKRDVLHFLFVARGSLNELSTQLIIAGRLGYIRVDEQEKLEQAIEKCGKLLNGMINYYRNKITNH